MNLFKDDVSSPEDLMVLAKLPSLSRGRYSPRNECFLPVSFLQRVLVMGPETVLLQKGQAPGEAEAAPWPYLVNWTQCLATSMARGRRRRLGRVPLSHSATLSHTQTSLHTFLELSK